MVKDGQRKRKPITVDDLEIKGKEEESQFGWWRGIYLKDDPTRTSIAHAHNENEKKIWACSMKNCYFRFLPVKTLDEVKANVVTVYNQRLSRGEV